MKKRIIAVVALVFMLASSLVMQSCGKNKTLDYMEDNLSKYVSISANDYKSFNVEIDIPNTSERDLPNEIIGILCDNKITPDGPVTNKKNITVGAGDVVNLYYRGYTLDDNGNKNYFTGGCNFDSETPTSLEIGSSSFVVGFEYNLIGKNQKDYATMDKLTEGDLVGSNDTISISYSVAYADGNIKTSQGALINLADENLDTVWGEGFAEYFKSKKLVVGDSYATGNDDKLSVKTTSTSSTAADEDLYFDITVEGAYRINATEECPVLEIEAYFPYNYNEVSLQNKTAKFEVFIRTVQDYDTPEFDDKFVTDTIKMSQEELAAYDGETLVEKYQSYLLAKLEHEYEDSVNSIIDNAFWDYIVDKAVFKKLPQGDIDASYKEMVYEVESAYISYQNSYGSSSQFSNIDQFARQYMGLASNVDWKEQLKADAELSIKQKLIFYYIIRTEGFVPSATEVKEIKDDLYNEYLNSYLSYYGITSGADDYDSKVESAKQFIDSQYDDAYWTTNAEYEYGMRKIRTYANVTYKNK